MRTPTKFVSPRSISATAVAVGFFLIGATVSGESIELDNVSIEQKVQNLRQAVVQKESRDASLLNHLQQTYRTKCGESLNSDCFLTEKDAFPSPSSSSDNVILFRGEKGQYDTPATSSLVRFILSRPNPFCNSACTLSKVAGSMYGLLGQLEIGPSDIGTLVVDGRLGRWIGQTRRTARYLPGSYDPLFPPEDLYERVLTPLEIIATGHFGQLRIGIELGESAQPYFDPMLSFTTNPSVAADYATPQQGLGRVIVVSVPRNSLRVFTKEQCQELIESNFEILNLYACNARGSFFQETEFNFLFVVPADYVRTTLLIGPKN